MSFVKILGVQTAYGNSTFKRKSKINIKGEANKTIKPLSFHFFQIKNPENPPTATINETKISVFKPSFPEYHPIVTR